MTQNLSLLMDGELEAREADRTIRDCCGDEDLKVKWQAYHLIGEALRGERPHPGASTRRIMEAIAKEPTVLAPRRRVQVSPARIAFAAAASVATVAVVGWIGLQDRGTSAGPTIAKSAAPAPEAAPMVASNVVPLNQLNEYMAVHRQFSSADYYRPVSSQAAAGR